MSRMPELSQEVTWLRTGFVRSWIFPIIVPVLCWMATVDSLISNWKLVGCALLGLVGMCALYLDVERKPLATWLAASLFITILFAFGGYKGGLVPTLNFAVSAGSGIGILFLRGLRARLQASEIASKP